MRRTIWYLFQMKTHWIEIDERAITQSRALCGKMCLGSNWNRGKSNIYYLFYFLFVFPFSFSIHSSLLNFYSSLTCFLLVETKWTIAFEMKNHQINSFCWKFYFLSFQWSFIGFFSPTNGLFPSTLPASALSLHFYRHTHCHGSFHLAKKRKHLFRDIFIWVSFLIE